MRPNASIPCFALLLFLLAGSAVRAQGADDKFMLCPFLGFDRCVPLTDHAMHERDLSDDDRQMIGTLQRLAASPDDALLDSIAVSFAPPRQPYASTSVVAVWYADRRDDSEQPRRFGCGLYLLLCHNGELIQINYGLQDKFKLIWNNPPAPQSK
jgi:hypothetical protein